MFDSFSELYNLPDFRILPSHQKETAYPWSVSLCCFCTQTSGCLSIICWKSYLFPLTCQDILSKISWSYIWRLIVGLSGLLVTRRTVFFSSYTINSKSGNVHPLNFVIFQGCLFAIPSSQELQSARQLLFHTNNKKTKILIQVFLSMTTNSGMVAHPYNLRTPEAEVGELPQVWEHPGL